MKKINLTNENFFESIDSELKAYLLGFLTADGSVGEKGRVCLQITIDDEYICKLLQANISKNTKLYYRDGKTIRKNQCSWIVNSLKMLDDLKKYTIVPNKTIKELSFNMIDDSLKIHFIRGYFDGDGCYYYGKTKTRVRSTINFTNSTKNILVEIRNYFLENHDLNLSLEEKISVTKNKYYVLALYGHKKCWKFCELIYKNSNYFLQRKFDKYFLANTEIMDKLKTYSHRNAQFLKTHYKENENKIEPRVTKSLPDNAEA